MSILAVTGVQVNDRDCTGELLFVASPQVEFSWRIETDSPGSRQCGYQIVATDADGRLLWDSGRVAGNACRGVPWRGAGLKAGDRVSFCIRTPVACRLERRALGPVCRESLCGGGSGPALPARVHRRRRFAPGGALDHGARSF